MMMKVTFSMTTEQFQQIARYDGTLCHTVQNCQKTFRNIRSVILFSHLLLLTAMLCICSFNLWSTCLFLLIDSDSCFSVWINLYISVLTSSELLLLVFCWHSSSPMSLIIGNVWLYSFLILTLPLKGKTDSSDLRIAVNITILVVANHLKQSYLSHAASAGIILF